MELKKLIKRLLSGEHTALARVISIVESDGELTEECLSLIPKGSDKSKVIGITGAPGVGKSTLVDKLASALAESGKRVAVLAIDPSSPLTGGALLGDRIRMRKAEQNEEVFIRSMASSGQPGGLAPKVFEVVQVIKAAGYQYILVETVGVGQSEVSIAELSDVSILVLIPGMGDGVQAMKAGVLEVADLFVINKSDYEGADILKKDLLEMLSLDLREKSSAKEKIFKTIAIQNEGVEELVKVLS